MLRPHPATAACRQSGSGRRGDGVGREVEDDAVVVEAGVQRTALGVEGQRCRAVDGPPLAERVGRGQRGMTAEVDLGGRREPPQAEGRGLGRRGRGRPSPAMPSSNAIDCMRASSRGSSSRQTPAGLPPKGASLKASTQARGMVMLPTMLSGRLHRAARPPACRRPNGRGSGRRPGRPGRRRPSSGWRRPRSGRAGRDRSRGR